MLIRAVFFDVGGPINTEVEHERLGDLGRAEPGIRAPLSVTHFELRVVSTPAFAAVIIAAPSYGLEGFQARVRN